MEVPRFYETVGKVADFWARETAVLLIWWDVLGSFGNDFGNKILGNYVYILVFYAVDELCLTLDGVRIFYLAL